MTTPERLRYWHNDFCGFTNNMPSCLLIWCCGQLGLAFIHCSLAKQAGYNPIAAFCCDLCCGCFGLAWNRMKIRQSVGIPGDYCYDCVAYQSCCLCMGVQECIQMKNMQGRMPDNHH